MSLRRRIFVEGYPSKVPAAQASPFSSLAGTDVSVRIASADGVDVAVGMGHVSHGCVNLCGAATLPAARRTGAWGALVRARLQDAADLPAVAFTGDYAPRFRAPGLRQRPALHDVGAIASVAVMPCGETRVVRCRREPSTTR